MKVVKWIGLAVAILIALLAILLFWFVSTFDANSYRDTLGEWAEQLTGRALELKGPISLDVFPVIALRVEDVRLANAKGFGTEPMLTAESAAAQLKIGPLLRGKIEVGSIVVDGLNLDLAQTADGKGNWEDLVASDDSTEVSETESPSVMDSIAIDGLSVNNSVIRWSEGNKLLYQASIDSLSAKPIAQGKPMKLRFAGGLQDMLSSEVYAVELSGLVTPQAEALLLEDFLGQVTLAGISAPVELKSQRLLVDLDKLTLEPAELKLTTGALELVATTRMDSPDKTKRIRGSINLARTSLANITNAFGIEVPADISITRLGDVDLSLDYRFDLDRLVLSAEAVKFNLLGPNYKAGSQPWVALVAEVTGEMASSPQSSTGNWSGSFTAAEFSPRKVLSQLGIALETANNDALTKAQLQGRFGFSGDTWNLKALEGKIDASRLSGSLVKSKNNTKVQIDLVVDQIDLDGYLPETTEEAESPETIAEIDLPFELMENLPLAGRLRLGRLQTKGIAVEAIDLTLATVGGKVRIAPLDAALYGGKFKGALEMQSGTGSPALMLEGQLNGVQLQPLLMAVAGEASMGGRANLKFNLTGRGKTVTDTLQTAGGAFSMSIEDGVLSGFHLGHTLCTAYNRLQRLPVPEPLTDEQTQTALSKLAFSAQVVDGVAKSKDLTAKNSYLNVVGAGEIQLAQKNLDFEIDAALAAPVDIPGCQSLDRFIGDRIPIQISGALAEPRIRPDFSKLLQRAVKDKVQEKLTEKLFDIFGPKKQKEAEAP